MRVGIHLHFSGQCEQAFEFYKSLLGGSLEKFRYGDTPAAQQVSPEWGNKLVHASLRLKEMEIVGADLPADQFQPAQGLQLIIQVEDEAEARRVFAALAQGGVISMPIQKTFWSPCYGMLVDKFGIPWEINCSS